MTQALADERVPLIYVPKFREWGLSVDGGPSMQQISHCPWCGNELPASLRERYFDTLERQGLELGEPGLPLHLRSDAWWRLDDP